MTSTFRPVVVAPFGTRCGWSAYGETGTRLTCQGDGPAIHVLTQSLPVAPEGTALCAYHSPFDPTDAEREAVGHPKMTHGEAGALRLQREAEADRSGVDMLAELITLAPVAPSARDRVVKFHRLSDPMIGVLAEVAKSRGLVGAWAMHHVVIREVKGATKRTLKALAARGILVEESTEDTRSGTGGLHDYVLTEAGYSVAEAIGCPVVELPTVPEVIATVVAIHDQADCETGCEVTIARGMALLPAGGDVCYGCGSIFTRPNGQEHPALTEISTAVVARNQAKGN